MRPLVVGQAPSRDTDGAPPFSGRSGERLAALLGVSRGTLSRRVDLVNLVERWPGKAGKGDAWPRDEARAAARMLLAVAPHDRLVLCGGNVCAAFGARLAPLERTTIAGKLVLHLPHPSGVNRWWNDPVNAEGARRTLVRFVDADLRSVA